MKYVYSMVATAVAIAFAGIVLYSGTVREMAFIKGGILLIFGAIIGCTTLILLSVKEMGKR